MHSLIFLYRKVLRILYTLLFLCSQLLYAKVLLVVRVSEALYREIDEQRILVKTVDGVVDEAKSLRYSLIQQ